MKLTESFGLLGTSTLGDADSKFDRYLPRLRLDGSIVFKDVDGSRIQSVKVREIAQWVSTFEDNDDLTHAILSSGKRDLRSIGARSTMYVTDARVVFVQDEVKDPRHRVVGHIRYPWVAAVLWRPRLGRFKRPQLQIWMHEDFPVKHLGSWSHYIELEFDDTVDTGAIALDLARRVSAHNLAHGAPAWAHDRLREQSQVTHLPEPDDNGEGAWDCPASVVCPLGAEYIDDSPAPAEWIVRGAQAPEIESATGSVDAQKRPPSQVILKRMLARGKSIARERGNLKVGTDDLLLALLIDSDTPVGQLMERHGADYDSVKLQLDALRPRYELSGDKSGRQERIRVGKQNLIASIARGLLNTMRAIEQREEVDDHHSALELGQQLLDLAERSGVSTLRAFAQVQVGGSYLALKRFNEAHNAFGAAAALRSAPLVTVVALLPKLDPIEIVDDALHGMWQVAGKRNSADMAAEIGALERLRVFRSEHGPAVAAAWAAAELARANGRNDDFVAAARWGDIAAEEYGRASNTQCAAEAAGIVAQSCNKAGEPARALTAAHRAIEGAVRAGDKELEAFARFERARANRSLGVNDAAWAEFCDLLPEARRRRPARARAIIIAMAEIDTVAAAAEATALAEDDVVFYGPRSAEIALAAAHTVLTVDRDAARGLLMDAVRLALDVVSHPDTVDRNLDRAFDALGVGFTATDDLEFEEHAVALAAGRLQLLDPDRLRRDSCLGFLKAVSRAGNFDVLAALAEPIVGRLAESPSNSVDIMVLVNTQWELKRALKSSGRQAAALAVQEDLIGWARRAVDLSSALRSRLGVHLASYGLDLMDAGQYTDANRVLTEAVVVLRTLLAEGEDCAKQLVFALQVHTRLAGLVEDSAAKCSRLEDLVAILDNAGAADWVPAERAWVEAELGGEDIR